MLVVQRGHTRPKPSRVSLQIGQILQVLEERHGVDVAIGLARVDELADLSPERGLLALE